MLVAISGSQGSGKSTILGVLKNKYHIIERRTARSILHDWNLTLKEVNESPKLTLEFQDEITKRKWDDEHWAVKEDEIIFTERTHADLFTYALVTLGPHNQHSEWLDSYFTTCLKNNQDYSLVFYITAGFFNPEHDGTRGSSPFYSRMVDLTMLDMTQKMVHNSRLMTINTYVLEQRISMIEAFCESLLKEKIRNNND